MYFNVKGHRCDDTDADIIVGRSARENESITWGFTVCDDDVLVHAHGASGAHVIVRRRAVEAGLATGVRLAIRHSRSTVTHARRCDGDECDAGKAIAAPIGGVRRGKSLGSVIFDADATVYCYHGIAQKESSVA